MGERLDRLRAWSSGVQSEARGANPYLEFGMTAPPPPGSVGASVAGLSVTAETATMVAAVYGCVGLLADSVASLPLRVLDKPVTENTAREIKTPGWLARPFEMMSQTDWIVCFIWSLALRGNFIGQIVERNRAGDPTQIAPIPPDMAVVKVLPDGSLEWRLGGYLVATDDIWHIKYQSVPGAIMGINPIQAMRLPFGLAHATDKWAANFYQNSGNPQGVIEVKGSLSEAATKQMAASWKNSHSGVNNSNMPAVLTEEAAFKPLNINPADQQLLESRKYSAEEISGLVFRIPPHMLGLNERSTSFGRGIEQQERGFVANTLSGYLCRLERGLTDCLPAGFVNFDISHRIRGSELERAQTASLLMLAGMVTANEARGKFFDMPPHADGEELFAPINTELLAKALEEVKKLEAEPDVKPPPTIVAPPSMNGKGNPASVPAPVK